MANPIQIKRSSTASAVPSAGSLLVGELAVNLADRKLFTKNGGGTVVLLAQPTPGTSAQLLASDGNGGYAAVTVGSGLSLSAGTLVATSAGGSSVTTSTTPPSSPSNGDLWWNSESGTLYVYYVDVDGGQWVAASPSGSVVDLTSPGPIGSVTPNTGAFTTVSDSKGEIRLIPQNPQSASYGLVLADAGKHILHPSADTTARTFTIPANGSVPYPIGTAITFVNQNAAGVVTIAITSDVMRLAGAGTTGSRTLAANGVATAIKITPTEWIISGTGLT